MKAVVLNVQRGDDQQYSLSNVEQTTYQCRTDPESPKHAQGPRRQTFLRADREAVDALCRR